MKICIVCPNKIKISETFIKAHVDWLAANVGVVDQFIPHLDGRPALSQSLSARAKRKVVRLVLGKSWDWEISQGYMAAFRKHQADVVLAEYGIMGARVFETCQIAGIPLVVHFHGFDASVYSVLEQYRERYDAMFRAAAAIVVVSRAMERKLVELGAPPENIHYNPYGVDCDQFGGADPESAPPRFLSVGRFVAKKAPHRTLQAFAELFRKEPQARLRMIGDGPLLGDCCALARVLGIEEAVTFLGARPHDEIQSEMRGARAFVQHSVEAENGDCEGTPVAILEAGASGLPVVATRHAGIPDVVIEEQTGLLVDEHDIPGMAAAMLRLARDPALARRFGVAGRLRVETEFSMPDRIGRLTAIIRSCISSELTSYIGGSCLATGQRFNTSSSGHGGSTQ